MANAFAETSLFDGQGIWSSGNYVRVRGEWFECSGPYDSEQPVSVWASRRQAQANDWVAARAGGGGFFEVSLDEVDQLLQLRPQCISRGGGPFEVSGVKDADGAWLRCAVPAGSPGYRALIRYVGEDWAWAEQLEGFEVYDVYSALGDCIQAWVPLSEISEYRVMAREIPVPGRSEGES